MHRQQPRFHKAVARRHLFPRRVRKRIRHPGIAAIRIVFDDDQLTGGLEIAANPLQDSILIFVPVEVQ